MTYISCTASIDYVPVRALEHILAALSFFSFCLFFVFSIVFSLLCLLYIVLLVVFFCCAKILQKIMTPMKINKYCGVGGVCVGGGGGHWRGAKILQKIMVPPISVIMINKYGGVGGGGGGIEGALKFYKR